MEAFFSFQKGEETGFAYLFDAIYPSLSFFAFGLLNQQQETEDVADEAFLKAWKQKDRFTSPENLRAFLFHVARNACIDIQRRKKTFLKIEKDLQHTSDTHEQSIDQRIAFNESLSQIYSLISLLPPKCQDIFSRSYIQGQSSKEIAEHLQLSINTVRAQKARGIALIRAKLINGKTLFLLLWVLFK